MFNIKKTYLWHYLNLNHYELQPHNILVARDSTFDEVENKFINDYAKINKWDVIILENKILIKTK
jgi:peptidase E